MIHGMDGRKLSKRHGATAVGDYQHLGILPGAMNNFLALLGWSPGGDREIVTVTELIELFSADGLLRKASVFDTKKLEWMNGQHMSRMTSVDLEPAVTPLILATGLVTAPELAARREWWLEVIDLLKVRARTTLDLVRQAEPYFREGIAYDEDAVAKHWKDASASAQVLEAAGRRLAEGEWDASIMENALRMLAEELGIPGGRIFQPLRVALVWQLASPGIFDVLLVLGRERSLARIDMAVRFLRAS
jgi:glutamyl-tRNA synthetase